MPVELIQDMHGTTRSGIKVLESWWERWQKSEQSLAVAAFVADLLTVTVSCQRRLRAVIERINVIPGSVRFSLSLAGAGSQCCSLQLHEHAGTAERAAAVSPGDPATPAPEHTSRVHCCRDASNPAPNPPGNDASPASSSHPAIDTGLVLGTNSDPDAGFCSHGHADPEHPHGADCGPGPGDTTATDPCPAPVCANPTGSPAAANICAGTATWHSSKYQPVPSALCCDIPRVSLCVAPCPECTEPIAVHSSFCFRPEGWLEMCKMCVFRCSQHCVKEGGWMAKLLKVKLAALCRKMRCIRPNTLFGHNQNLFWSWDLLFFFSF